MDKYEKVERPREEPEIKDNEIRITTKGKVRNSISYATTLFKEKGFTEVVLKAMGRAINKTVTIAEIIKRRIPNLHQITEISSTDITDVYEPLEEGLDTIETTRHVSSITIILSTVPLDTSAPGYQAPLPEEQVKDQSASQPSATSPVPGTVQPLKGPRRGAATRGGRGPRGGMRGGHQGNDSDFGHGALAIGPEGDGALIMPQLAQTVPQGNHPSQRPLNAAPFRGRGRGGHDRRGGGFGMPSQGAYPIPVAGFIQQPQQGYLGVYPQPQGFVAYPTAIPIMAAPQGLPLNGGMLRGGYGGRGGRGGRRGGRGGFTGGVMDTQPHLVPPQHQLQGDASSAGFLPRRSVRGARGGRGGRRGSSSVQQGDSQGAHGSPAGNQPAQQQS